MGLSVQCCYQEMDASYYPTVVAKSQILASTDSISALVPIAATLRAWAKGKRYHSGRARIIQCERRFNRTLICFAFIVCCGMNPLTGKPLHPQGAAPAVGAQSPAPVSSASSHRTFPLTTTSHPPPTSHAPATFSSAALRSIGGSYSPGSSRPTSFSSSSNSSSASSFSAPIKANSSLGKTISSLDERFSNVLHAMVHNFLFGYTNLIT